MSGKIIAIVGMAGSGKSQVADYLVKKGFLFLRMGQLTLDEVMRKGLLPTEENERKIREGLRKEHGMAAYAILNVPRFDELLKKGDVIADNLLSWEEYLFLKERYGNKLFVLSIIASPSVRYNRLMKRKLKENDKSMRRRPMTVEQAVSRDYDEIGRFQKGGPIAMADYNIINEGSVEELHANINLALKKFGE